MHPVPNHNDIKLSASPVHFNLDVLLIISDSSNMYSHNMAWWHLLNWALGNQPQWCVNKTTMISIQENTFAIVGFCSCLNILTYCSHRTTSGDVCHLLNPKTITKSIVISCTAVNIVWALRYIFDFEQGFQSTVSYSNEHFYQNFNEFWLHKDSIDRYSTLIGSMEVIGAQVMPCIDLFLLKIREIHNWYATYVVTAELGNTPNI